MRIPQTPPALLDIIDEIDFHKVMSVVDQPRVPGSKYPHWDKLRHLPLPEGIDTHRVWWLLIKLARKGQLKPIGLADLSGSPFQFSLPEVVQQMLHQIDLSTGGQIGISDQITNPATRDRYLINSLIEEAITSSQLEGAVTTREVAKEMIRSERKPADINEQMILNNYLTMQKILTLKNQDLSPELIFEIHKITTDGTLEDTSASGRLRTPSEVRVVGDDFGQTYHTPPPAHELKQRMQAMCDFANGKEPSFFVHPAIRAIILHFWLAYDHPFVDGNGRTARALFYWAMLRNGYWLAEFISISSILKKAPVKYARSFLYTETDDNDLNYFIIAQSEAILQAIRSLNEYIERKVAEMRSAETHIRALNFFNPRQRELIRHAIKHPRFRYTISSHQNSHGVVYQTARTDLMDLCRRGILIQDQRGRTLTFVSPADISERLLRLEA